LATNLPMDIGRDKRSDESRIALERFLQEQDSESPLTQYVQVLLRRRWIVLALIAAGLLVAAFVNATTVKLYRSSGSIQIDRESARVVNVDDTTPKSAYAAQEFYQTQYGLLRSRALAEMTVASLRLADNAKFLYGYGGRAPTNGAPTGDRRQRERMATGLLMAHLTIEPVRGSGIVRISFDSPEPGLSAAIVNGISKDYIASNINRRYQSTAYARNVLLDQINQTRTKLEASERALVNYASAQKIITLDSSATDKGVTSQSGTTLVSNDLRTLSDALSTAKVERSNAEARYQQAIRAGGGVNSAEGIADPTLNSLRSQRATLTAEYQKLLAQFRPDYPQMVALKQQIAELDKQLAKQGGSLVESLRANYLAAAQRESSLQGQVDAAKNSMFSLRDRSVEYNTLQRDVDTTRGIYDTLLQRYKEIGIAGSVGATNISVIDSALPSGGPATPRVMMNLMLGLLAGLLAGIAVAFMLEQLDESIIAPHDLERKLGVALLGSVPKITDGSEAMELLGDGKTPLAEAYLSLQTALRLTTSKGAPRQLFVTSSRPSEGKSTTAMAIARNFASLGKKTILVDCDLRNPSIHKMLGIANAGGMSNLLAGATDLPNYIRKGPVPGLDVMSSGPIPPNPAELLAGPNLQRTFEILLSQYDHVVIDGPPVLGLADAPLIASYAEATMFVVAAKSTHTRIARVSLRRLADVHANILGAVLTKFDAKRVGYDYGYEYEYGEKRIGFMGRSSS